MHGRSERVRCGIGFRIGPKNLGNLFFAHTLSTQRDKSLEQIERSLLRLGREAQRPIVHHHAESTQHMNADWNWPCGMAFDAARRRNSQASNHLSHML